MHLSQGVLSDAFPLNILSTCDEPCYKLLFISHGNTIHLLWFRSFPMNKDNFPLYLYLLMRNAKSQFNIRVVFRTLENVFPVSSMSSTTRYFLDLNNGGNSLLNSFLFLT